MIIINNKNKILLKRIYTIWYNEKNSEMKTDSVTAKDRHLIISSPLVDTKFENIWGAFEQLILGSYTILWLNIYYPKLILTYFVDVRNIKGIFIDLDLSIVSFRKIQLIQV